MTEPCVYLYPYNCSPPPSPHSLDCRLPHPCDCRLPHSHFAPLPSDLRLPYAGKILRLSCYWLIGSMGFYIDPNITFDRVNIVFNWNCFFDGGISSMYTTLLKTSQHCPLHRNLVSFFSFLSFPFLLTTIFFSVAFFRYRTFMTDSDYYENIHIIHHDVDIIIKAWNTGWYHGPPKALPRRFYAFTKYFFSK